MSLQFVHALREIPLIPSENKYVSKKWSPIDGIPLNDESFAYLKRYKVIVNIVPVKDAHQAKNASPTKLKDCNIIKIYRTNTKHALDI